MERATLLARSLLTAVERWSSSCRSHLQGSREYHTLFWAYLSELFDRETFCYSPVRNNNKDSEKGKMNVLSPLIHLRKPKVLDYKTRRFIDWKAPNFL